LRIERTEQATRVSGRLGFANAAAALARADEVLTDAGVVDVSGLERPDSATLAVLLAWAACASRRGSVLRYAGIGAELAALARLAAVGPLLAGARG
jgi:phospholipid transport system transporter-binding protein